ANKETAVTTNGSQRFFMTANILVEAGGTRGGDVRFHGGCLACFQLGCLLAQGRAEFNHEFRDGGALA
ncbi:MAG TPA: hypothetical protein VEN79_05300, partial [Terriglobia bacterium]|nr:hypothetical protein [Terriglobia bacterium]